MNKYGLINKSGECQVVCSDKNIEEFMKHLNSAEWVCLNFQVPSHWENLGDEDIDFLKVMVSLKNIESVSFMESEVQDANQ